MAYILSLRFEESPESGGDCHASQATARQLFERFHSFAPPRTLRRNCRRLVPPVLVNLGELRGLIYSSDKGQCGRPRTFIHFMETPPLLTTDPGGKQLYIVGGNYRVTAKGIEG
ncbi:MAG TPA: hypothetical protein VKB46_20555 [Pyrinomonadaceae bacterium]|nr:hypothetical protein [Pyrinomonadaceae bacterium]